MWVERHGAAWRVRDRVGGRVVTLAGGYPTKASAAVARDLLRADALRGQALVPRGAEMTLNAWLDMWLPAYEISLKPSAAHSEPGRIKNHVRPLLGHLPLGDIDHLTVQRWVAQLLRGVGSTSSGKARKALSVKSVRNAHGILYKIMQAAVKAKLIASNPCEDTDLPERRRREMRFLTEPEAARLIAALPAHWRPLVLLLLATGLRWGEAVGLRVGQVDLLARPPRVTIVEQLQELASTGEIVFVEPKSERSRRTVTITRKVALALAPLVSLKGRRDMVFDSPRGGYVRARNFRRTWIKACRAAGLDGLRIHDLRHTHAAWLISDGRPLTAVQHRLGHSSIAVTSDLYGHLMPAVDEGILAAVDAALEEIDLDALAAELDDELADELAG